uniref:Uncharacterized protein n=1 Tax=Romanomermis culicivorax TaxID=13658 RepID=A0A915L9K7_ROMCU
MRLAAAANAAVDVRSVPPPLFYSTPNQNPPPPSFSPIPSDKLAPSHSSSTAASVAAKKNPLFQLMTSETTAATWGSLTASPTGTAGGVNLSASQTLPSNLSALSVQQYANPMSSQQRQQTFLMSQSFGAADLLLSPSNIPNQQPMSSSWHEGFSPKQLNPNSLSQSLENQSVTSLRSQLDQAQKQAQVSIAHVYLLRDQLASETVARIESQTRTQQLMQANKELVDQVQTLVSRLQNLEARLSVDSAIASPQPFASPLSPKYSSPSRNARSPSPRHSGAKSSPAAYLQPETSRLLEVPPSASFYGESGGADNNTTSTATATRQSRMSHASSRVASPTSKKAAIVEGSGGGVEGKVRSSATLMNKQMMKMMKKQMSLDVQSAPHRNNRKIADKKGRSILGRSFELERIQLEEMQIESEEEPSDSEYRVKESKALESKSRRQNLSSNRHRSATSKENSYQQDVIRQHERLHRSSKKKSSGLGLIAETYSDSQSSSTDVIDLPLNPPYSADRNIKNRKKLSRPASVQSIERFPGKNPITQEYGNDILVRSNKMPQQNHVDNKQEDELHESALSSSSEEQITITSPSKSRSNCFGRQSGTLSKYTNHKQEHKEDDSSEKDFRIYDKQLQQQNTQSRKITASGKGHNFILSGPNR